MTALEPSVQSGQQSQLVLASGYAGNPFFTWELRLGSPIGQYDLNAKAAGAGSVWYRQLNSVTDIYK